MKAKISTRTIIYLAIGIGAVAIIMAVTQNLIEAEMMNALDRAFE